VTAWSPKSRSTNVIVAVAATTTIASAASEPSAWTMSVRARVKA
jgi:hypothetical protein